MQSPQHNTNKENLVTRLFALSVMIWLIGIWSTRIIADIIWAQAAPLNMQECRTSNPLPKGKELSRRKMLKCDIQQLISIRAQLFHIR